jgi:hypothetical protein
MRQTQPSPSGPIQSFIQSYHTAKWLMQFPALTVMVWLRHDLGYRMVSFARIVPVTGFLFVISVLAGNGDTTKRLWGLLIFAVLTLALGIFQRIRGWFQIARKVKRHSYYLGTSLFSKFRWIPESLRCERRLERFVDPIACGLIGYAVLHLSPALGLWLMASAVSLRSYEWAIHMRDLNLNLDILDGMIRSEQQNQTVEEFEAQSGWHKNEASGGLPTGLGADLESQVTISVKQRRGNNKNKNTIDI